jgi:small ligand-binding sensory domain FIST
VFGGVVDAVIGRGREIESGAAASVLLLGGMRATPQIAVLECHETPDGWSVFGLDESMHRRAAEAGGLLVVACPKSFSAEMLDQSLESMRADGDAMVNVLGGNLSRMSTDRNSVLFAGDRIADQGAVAMAVPPGLRWSTVVSQGCRPIGEPMVITEVRGQRIFKLGGKPALDRLTDMYYQLPSHERQMAMNMLLMGRAISEYSETFSHGEFLIRNITSVEINNKSIVVADRVRAGQTVRFHLVDANAADGDMRQLLSRARKDGVQPVAACLFTCNGRGERLFGQPDHDAQVVEQLFPGLPTAGFFAAGEFGPVAGSNLIHGFTAVIALLCEEA